MPHNNFPMLFGPRRVFKACCAYCRSHSISINLNRANVLWVPRMGTKCTVYPTRFVYTLPIIDSKTETIFVLTWECEQTWLADLRTNMTYEHRILSTRQLSTHTTQKRISMNAWTLSAETDEIPVDVIGFGARIAWRKHFFGTMWCRALVCGS